MHPSTPYQPKWNWKNIQSNSDKHRKYFVCIIKLGDFETIRSIDFCFVDISCFNKLPTFWLKYQFSEGPEMEVSQHLLILYNPGKMVRVFSHAIEARIFGK